jgi:hypothetical protein
MMSLLLMLVNSCLMIWLARIMHRRQSTTAGRVFWIALSVKMITGISLGLLYFNHYGAGDTISFWQDGKQLSYLLRESPAQVLSFYWDESSAPDITRELQQQKPRSVFFVKIAGVLALISGGNYWIMASWLSLVSFAGTWFLYGRIVRLFPDAKSAAGVALLFVPSVVFWSSGLIKESLGLAALAVLVSGVLSIAGGERVPKTEWLLIGVSLWMGWHLKYYWIGIFLPAAIPVMMATALSRRFPGLTKYDGMLWLGIFVVCLMLATNTHPNFYTSRFLEVIYNNNLEFTRMSLPPRIVQYVNLEPEMASMVMNAPAALLAGLFRPFVWEAFNTLSWVAAIENLVILFLVVQALVSIREVFRSPVRVLFFSTITYVVLLSTFLALSTPNFGTLSRYRIGALPFLVMLCLLPATPVGKWLAARRWFG